MLFSRNDLSRKMMLIALTAKTATKADLINAVGQLKIAIKEIEEYDSTSGHWIVDDIRSRVCAPYYMLGLPTLGKYSDEIGMNVQTVMRRIADTSYKKFSILIDSIRMVVVKELLLTTDKSVIEISHLMGYSQSPTFYRWFKGCHDMSPSEFRLKNNELLGHENLTD